MSSIEGLSLLSVNPSPPPHPSPSLPSQQSEPSAEPKTYSQFTAFAVSINYIIGAGILGLPFATFQAGVPLTLAMLGFFAVFLVLGCWWVLEIIARAQGVADAERDGARFLNNRITTERWPYARFCGLFGGRWGRAFAQVIIAAYCYGALWAYSASFSSSLALIVFDVAAPEQPECNIYHSPSADCWMAYYLSMGLYALVVLPLSLMEISEQQLLQKALTAYRFVTFGVMLLTAGVGLAISGPMQGRDGADSRGVWAFKWAGFGVALPSAAVALCIHYNIPDALAPTREKDHLRRIVSAAQLTSLGFYAAVGVVCAVFFNPPDPLITLNWLLFTGRGAGGWSAGVGSAWWAVALRMVVILFPVIDLVNVFPLVVVTLGGNIATALPIAWPESRRKLVSRLLAALPPLILGTAIGRLDTIFTVTGWFGFAIEFIVPTVFQWLSSRRCVRAFGAGADETPYSGFHSRPLFFWTTLAVGIAALATTIGLTIDQWAK